MFGLLLSFLLRGASINAQDLRVEGVLSGMRALVWFAGFALFASVPWNSFVLRLTLIAGLAAVLFNLLISGGLTFPALMQPFWIIAALALAPCPIVALSSWPRRLIPVPLMAAVAIGYFLFAFQPVTSSRADLAEAGQHYKDWPGVESRWREQTDKAVILPEKYQVSQRAGLFVQNMILT